MEVVVHHHHIYSSHHQLFKGFYFFISSSILVISASSISVSLVTCFLFINRKKMEASRAEGKRSLKEDDQEEEEDDEDSGGGIAGEEDKIKKKGKRGSSSAGAGGPTTFVSCQVENCRANMTDAKKYHRRHKVCDFHAKAPVVRVEGLAQRFCQQCSRFHELSEFDDTKRSCRRRLAGHNERRRKSSADYHGEGSN